MEENTIEENLKESIRLFYEDKKQLDEYKKSTEKLNQEIKDTMNELGKTEFESDDLKAKISIQKRESFNEDLLLQTLKELNITGPIKTKEYVDMDELEDAIYNGRLSPTTIANCRITKEVTTLKVTERKKK